MRDYRILLAAAAAYAAAGVVPVSAQTYYLGLGGGYGHAHESDLTLAGAKGSRGAFEAGYAGFAVFGFESVDRWRLEGEFSWRRNNLDEIDGAASDGDFQAYALMVNVYYGIDTGSVLTPYLGAGGGFARVGVAGAPGPASVDGFDIAPALQAMAGVGVALSDWLTLSFEYRYFAADGVAMLDGTGAGFAADYRTSSGLVGMRAGF